MTDPTATPAVAAAPASIAAAAVAPTPRALAESMPLVQAGARWFWWIAGLSAVNVGMQHSGSDTHFVVGLGITGVVDAVFSGLPVAGLVLDALVLAFFFAMGLVAQRGSLRAFYIGGGVYALDALLYLAAADWLPVGFHVLVLFFVGKGALALREALRAQPPAVPGAAA
ncbi:MULTISPECIES: hypothetical protein [unclassified Rhizobacter]|uniref:hypothetical protein n=1 Tax=unclassified Rhizobacter TaxID=2640088 RepID=UPI0006F5A02D|nr:MULTISPECIES: hypothetical protein [unclassified Rhizobacter]KQU64550.1 hypothetical protein ASC88_12745 [Rhizobacter sp. Root29]KQW03368.1 hypothetical protein ASC98_27495 [Rhizobacter sp. Root1238]KRB13700.1 hypothetical protein ASE08_27605 [Rhizobacter sp. Root16D2]